MRGLVKFCIIRRLWYNSISNSANNRCLFYQRLFVSNQLIVNDKLLFINRVVSGGVGLDSDTA
ncbi:hypothetical protein DVP88_21395 [Yersinia enterocolitica]|nr:hypothetical protein [Yersinia enterocolitica]EKN5159799.1 hypothetical protein [Yersinia enterocolitica]